MTDQEAMALGAQDAERYIANAMTSQMRPLATNADDPFVGPAFQNLLTVPGNEISARGMARLQAARGENFLSRMRGRGTKSKKGKEREDSEEEVVHQAEADKERAFREEKAINEMIKGKLAAKDAANGSVRGAGMPRIDYGPPTQRTALGGSGPTDEERAHAVALGNRRNKGDNSTAREQLEGYSHT